jgi:hypothetical protein
MRYFFLAVFVITLSCDNHNERYSDWFDMNLKGDPRSVHEVSILPPIDTTFPNVDLTNRDFSLIHEYFFNSAGMLTKEFQYVWQNPNRSWINYKEYSTYQDSIVVQGHFTGSGGGDFKEVRFLDKNGYMVRKIILRDTVYYHRTSKHKIERKYEHLIGIDSPMKRRTDLKYNDHGDIEYEKLIEIQFLINGESLPFEIVNQYQYIYDNNDNWIIKICLNDSNISSITQRKITYK